MASNNRNNTERVVVTFAQLLATAKKGGFRGVRTEIVQLPTEANKWTAVFRATVTMLDSVGEMHFDGTGEATPVNVKPAMVNCLPRIAETRAVVRALKLAVGVGEVAAEELADYDDTEARPAPRANAQAAEMSGVMTEPQEAAIRTLSQRTGHQLPDMEGWSAVRAGQHIKLLQTTAATAA
jgi:hypothetical protein